MNIRTKILTSIAALMMASTAQAGLIINSIDMLVASTSFVVREDNTFGDAIANFGAALSTDPVCMMSLDEMDGVGGKQNCGGSRRNTGTLFAISGYNSGTTELELGLDWGRGGYAGLFFEGSGLPEITKYTNDIWWGRNWGNSDVLNFELTGTGNFEFLLLGFEGCCNGINSGRWRSGDEWKTLSVVSVPSVLSLYTVGLLGLYNVARKRNRP